MSDQRDGKLALVLRTPVSTPVSQLFVKNVEKISDETSSVHEADSDTQSIHSSREADEKSSDRSSTCSPV
jgi:hypothetical protein